MTEKFYYLNNDGSILSTPEQMDHEYIGSVGTVALNKRKFNKLKAQGLTCVELGGGNEST